MLRKLAIALVAAVSVAAIPIGAMAAHGGGGGGGHGGGGGGRGGGGGGSHGGHSYSGGPGFSGRGMPGGNAFVNRGVAQPFVNRAVTGQPFVNRGVVGQPFVNRGIPGATPFVGHRVSSDHRFAFIGHRRVHGRHLRGFIPGIGYAFYWYYDDCYVLTDDYGWINICGNDY
jgi:hypothetical protein